MDEELPPLERKPGDPEAASHLFALAEVARRKGNAQEGQRLYRLCVAACEAVEEGRGEDATVEGLNFAALSTGLGETLLATGHVAHAAGQLEHAYDCRKQQGSTPLEMAPLLLSLAAALRQCNDVAGAASACEVAHTALCEAHGPAHGRSVTARGALVECLQACGRAQEAMVVCQTAVEALDKEMQAAEAAAGDSEKGEAAAALKAARLNLGNALMALGDVQLRHAPGEAEVVAALASLATAKESGAKPEALAAAQAAADAATGPNEAAAENLARAVFILDACLGPDAAQSGTAAAYLTTAYRRCGRLQDALQVTTRLAAATEKALGPTSPAAITHRLVAAELCTRMGRHGEAVEGLTQLVAAAKAVRGKSHPMTAELFGELAKAKRAAGDAAGATAALREAAAVRKAAAAEERSGGGPPGAWARTRGAVAAVNAIGGRGQQRRATQADLLA